MKISNGSSSSSSCGPLGIWRTRRRLAEHQINRTMILSVFNVSARMFKKLFSTLMRRERKSENVLILDNERPVGGGRKRVTRDAHTHAHTHTMVCCFEFLFLVHFFWFTQSKNRTKQLQRRKYEEQQHSSYVSDECNRRQYVL